MRVASARAPGYGSPPHGEARPLHQVLSWTPRDYAKRVWDNAGEDNVLFLAGGIAFNILLAAVPFLLLLVVGASRRSCISRPSASTARGRRPLHRPAAAAARPEIGRIRRSTSCSPTSSRARGAIKLYSAIGFVWFSTRLFGSLRTRARRASSTSRTSAASSQGKIFDIKITSSSTLLFAAHTLISTYVADRDEARRAACSSDSGDPQGRDGRLEYAMGPHLLAFAFIALMFFSLYKFLPIRRVRTKTAWVAALFTSVMFELAQVVFSAYVQLVQSRLAVHRRAGGDRRGRVLGLLRGADLHPRRRGRAGVRAAPRAADAARGVYRMMR